MIGRDGVPEDSEATSLVDGRDGWRLKRKAIEKGWLLNVGAITVPSIGLSGFRGNFVPSWVLLGKVPIKAAKDFGLEGGFHGLSDFFAGGPKIL